MNLNNNIRKYLKFSFVVFMAVYLLISSSVIINLNKRVNTLNKDIEKSINEITETKNEFKEQLATCIEDINKLNEIIEDKTN